MASPAPLVVALLVVSALGVARLQPRLADIAHEVKERQDVYVLPPPVDFQIADLGYDAAAIDLLWSKLLIDYGTHIAEKRDFHPDPYIDTITFVEPTYEPVYHFADTFLCFRPLHGTADDARKARLVLEQGTRALPSDPDVWLEYGQFVAFLGPGFLTDPKEKERWRYDGAIALAKAVDVGADASRAISAATLLTEAGQRDASIKALQRGYEATDDPATRQQIATKLDRLRASAEADAIATVVEAIESRWRDRYPFLTRGEFLLIGPAPSPTLCAGPSSANDPACARDWDAVLDADRRAREGR